MELELIPTPGLGNTTYLLASEGEARTRKLVVRE